MLVIKSTLEQRLNELVSSQQPWYSTAPLDALTQVNNVSAVIARPYDPDVIPWWYGRQWINTITWDEFVANGITGIWNRVTPWWTPWLWLYWRNTNIVFTAASQTQVDRAAWSINMPDWTVYSISAWNTWAMSWTSLYYIYLDINVSLTVLQVTTTSGNAVGVWKIMICVAQRNPNTWKLATFQAFWTNSQSTFITAWAIAANTITANEIASNTITASQIAAWTITADRMNVSTLSAISANIWTVTAGNINGVAITWWTIQTATSWQRVIITWSNNNITFYNSSWNNCWSVSWSTVSAVRAITVWDWSNTQFLRLWTSAWILLDGGVAVFSNTDILWWANNTYNLWSDATRWRTLYLANWWWPWLNLAQTVTTASLTSNRHTDIVINWTTYKMLLNI